MPRVPPEIADLLDAAGLEWRVERGSRHAKLFVAGRMVTVLPHSPGNKIAARAGKNALACVRRFLRAITSSPQKRSSNSSP